MHDSSARDALEQHLREAHKNVVFDAFSFLPFYDTHTKKYESDKIVTESGVYLLPGEDVGGSKIGKEYDIILLNKDLKITDKFIGVLVSPIDYIINMIRNGFYGVVARRTKTSASYISDILACCAPQDEKTC